MLSAKTREPVLIVYVKFSCSVTRGVVRWSVMRGEEKRGKKGKKRKKEN